MSLEDLLAPVKWADEQVLRQYTKLVQQWEMKERSRYSLAHAFGLPSYFTNIILVPYYLLPKEYYHFTTLLLQCSTGAWQGFDFRRTISESRYQKQITDGTMTINPDHLAKKITSSSRFPALVTGLTLMGVGVYEMVDYFKNKNLESFNKSCLALSMGYSFFGTASSIYIKDSDPKLLGKAPFWKQAVDYVKERVMPQPQPVPIENYTTLEKRSSSI